jgi:hypothetical protein
MVDIVLSSEVLKIIYVFPFEHLLFKRINTDVTQLKALFDVGIVHSDCAATRQQMLLILQDATGFIIRVPRQQEKLFNIDSWRANLKTLSQDLTSGTDSEAAFESFLRRHDSSFCCVEEADGGVGGQLGCATGTATPPDPLHGESAPADAGTDEGRAGDVCA